MARFGSALIGTTLVLVGCVLLSSGTLAASASVVPATVLPDGAVENCPWRGANLIGVCYIPIKRVPQKDLTKVEGLPVRQTWCTDQNQRISLGVDGRTEVTTLAPICFVLYEEYGRGEAILLHSSYLSLTELATNEEHLPPHQNGNLIGPDITADIDFNDKRSNRVIQRVEVAGFLRSCYATPKDLDDYEDTASDIGKNTTLLRDSDHGTLHLYIGGGAPCS